MLSISPFITPVILLYYANRFGEDRKAGSVSSGIMLEKQIVLFPYFQRTSDKYDKAEHRLQKRV